MIKRITIPRCPVCQQPVALAVKADEEIKKANFIGKKGNRWTICIQGAHWHIRVGDEHRYVFLVHKSKVKT